MILEGIINATQAENKPYKVLVLGFIYCSIAIFLALWVFKTHSTLVFVFLASLAAIPLVYALIKQEEEKDLTDLQEKFLLKEHGKALKVFMFLFIGMVIAVVLWYVVLPGETVGTLFSAQSETYATINGGATGMAAGQQFESFLHITFNNLRVVMFCFLFAFLYGFEAIFILTWNASVIGVAIGDFIRTQLAVLTDSIGLHTLGSYFTIISFGLLKYVIHGIPEILAYFVAGLAAGIISIAVIRHDFGSRKFEHILLDSSDLLLLSLALVFIAGLLEVYVTPIIF